jgi:hypothetical protein
MNKKLNILIILLDNLKVHQFNKIHRTQHIILEIRIKKNYTFNINYRDHIHILNPILKSKY